MQKFHEVDNAQTRYMISIYNSIGNNGTWHIHGEARKPDSIVIGQDKYSRLLHNYINRLDDKGKAKEYKSNVTKQKEQLIGS